MKKKVDINDVIEGIDRRLIEQNVPIPNRYIRAIGEVSKHFGNARIPLSPMSLLPNNDLGNQLCIWLHDWYDSRYGELQCVNSDLGFFYQKIRGDLWFYRVPNFYGTCNFFIDKDLTVRGGDNETNILRMSPKMTQAYVNTLTDIELERLMEIFSKAIESFQVLSAWRVEEFPFCKAVDADLNTITAQLETQRMNYGQARWAYLQCSEKILKAWLLRAGVKENELKDKYGHNMRKLISAFNERYQVKLSLSKIEAIECSASARYRDENFTSDDIIEAQEWFLNLIKIIGFSPKVV